MSGAGVPPGSRCHWFGQAFLHPDKPNFAHEPNRRPIRNGRIRATEVLERPELADRQPPGARCRRVSPDRISVLPERLALFLIAAITDALDGYFARLLKQDTKIGRQLDPLIDKVIVSGCYIYLATISGTGVKAWMVSAIVIREILIQGLRSHLEGQGQAFGARTAGKLKTVVQCISISAVLFCLPLQAGPSLNLLLWIRDAFTWAAVALTLYSGLMYVWVAFPKLRSES